ncbi:MAG TPA: diguanylate cyclase, partial [Clostridia bacterium]|nr:diguanylate cyclase [Clostridia bacterium]
AMAEQLNQINQDMLKGGILNIESQREREIYFANILKSYPDAAMSFIGLVDGSFYGAKRNLDGEIHVVRNNKSTDGASFYYSTNELGAGINLEERYPDFDPRTRPWYTSAIEANKATYSEVYMHFVFQEPTITASRPIYDENDEIIGVFGVNYLISWMNDLLSNLLIGKNGHVFVADSGGMLLATTLDIETYTADDDNLNLISIYESQNKFIEKSLMAFDKNDTKERPSVNVAGKKYYTGVIDLDKSNLDWKLYFLLAEDDFLGNIKAAMIQAALLLALFVLISVAASSLVARRIAKPIEKLSLFAESLSDGMFKPVINDERIEEIYSLTNSFNVNGEKLASLVADLEKQVAIRTNELECANRELEKLSFKDGLTGIYNRLKFDESYLLAWKTALRHGRRLGIFMLDIDYFKKYNDTYGHLKGDDCLRDIANELLRRLRRSTDFVARYGGEEFVILIQDVDLDRIEGFAESIRSGIEGLNIEHSTSKFNHVTVSIGVSTMIPTADVEPTELIRRADLSLYRAKEEGRNRVHMDTPQ